ncbi:MAG: class I SAM-dependent methyltransferase [Burkholderiales bacterium]|nr:class I SAM-dependent methyltransferase [Burkholderiales bacterium]
MNLLSHMVHRTLEALPSAPTAPLAVEWPGGRAGPAHPRIHMRFRRTADLLALGRGHVGKLADLYVKGQLNIEGSMRDVMCATSALATQPLDAHAPWPWQSALRHLRSTWRHSPWRDARQINFHYDIGDEFYALWLDPRRVYSCAYFEAPDVSLARAQEAKLDLICRKLGLHAGLRLLDIGAGWGGLLMWAAEHYGVQATGITLSHNQHDHVRQIIAERGLGQRVQMHLLDWRDMPEDQPFDRIASVGMVEHVGRAHLTEYFAKVHRLLRPGGLVMNHGITAGGLHNDQLGAGIGNFIERHIFPGGELAHVAHVNAHVAEAGLELLDAENLRPHYARTLWAWSDALETRLPEAHRVADAATVRAYRLYLAGCAMAFEQGWLSLHQLLCARPSGEVTPAQGAMRGAQCDYPFRRDYMYRT